MRRVIRSASIAALALAASAAAAETPMETLRAFEARLDGADSATAVLRGWCADRRLADPPTIRAVRDAAAEGPADEAVRRQLNAAAGEVVRHRHVRLMCGDRVLSEADNWYRPAALTEAMNAALDGGDTPFGTVVGPLHFHRRTLAVDWRADDHAKAMPRAVLRHRAVLETPAGAPFSLVVETYTAEVLAVSP